MSLIGPKGNQLICWSFKQELLSRQAVMKSQSQTFTIV